MPLPRPIADHIDPSAYFSGLLTNLHDLRSTGGGDTTRAVLHAESLIPQILGLLGGRSASANPRRLHDLETQLDEDLKVIHHLKH